MLTAKDLMTKDVISVTPDTKVEGAIKQLVANRISGVPVVHGDGSLFGIFTEDDALMLCREPNFDKLLKQKLKDCRVLGMPVVNTGVITVDAKESVERAALILFTRKIKRLPVLRGKRMVGILSRRDVLKALLKSSGLEFPFGDKSRAVAGKFKR